MQVGYELKQSNIEGAGYGLFVTEDVPKGAVIWKFRDEDHIFLENEKAVYDRLNKMSTFEEKQDFLVHCYGFDGRVCFEIDDGHTMNHSKNPNAGYDLKKDQKMNCYALRDIKKGEEIFVSYDVDGFLDFPPWFAKIAKEYKILLSTKDYDNPNQENLKYLLNSKL